MLVSLHIGILILTGIAVVYSDHEAWLYIRGRKQTLDEKLIKRLHILVWIGLLGMIVTGVFLVLPGWQYYLSLPGFLVKMVFVGILLGNSFVISSLKSLAFTTPFGELPPARKRHLFVSGAASVIGWVGATLAAIIFLG